MKRMKKLLLTTAMMLFTASLISAQEMNQGSDTTAVTLQQTDTRSDKQAQEQTQEQTQERTREQSGVAEQDQAQTRTNTQAGAQNQAGNNSGVKKVQSARPDWSKARGARPPSVERPSGSRIPKGVGKPAGAKGPGKR